MLRRSTPGTLGSQTPRWRRVAAGSWPRLRRFEADFLDTVQHPERVPFFYEGHSVSGQLGSW